MSSGSSIQRSLERSNLLFLDTSEGSWNKDKKENDNNKGRHFPFLSHFYFLSKSQGEIN